MPMFGHRSNFFYLIELLSYVLIPAILVGPAIMENHVIGEGGGSIWVFLVLLVD